jgi:hypothetical protein
MQNFESGLFAFSLVRKGNSPAIEEHEEFRDKLFYFDYPEPGPKNVVGFKNVRSGNYTVYLTMHDKPSVGAARFAVTRINVLNSRAVALDLPPLYTVKVSVKLDRAPMENASYALWISGVAGSQRDYSNHIPMNVSGDRIIGDWDCLLVPCKYKIVMVEYGRVGILAPYVNERRLKDVKITAESLVNGLVSIDMNSRSGAGK